MESLVDADLYSLVSDGRLGDVGSYVQPASIDIPLGPVAYLVTQKFLPFADDVNSLIDRFSIDRLDLTTGAILLKGQTYLVKCLDVDLPSDLHVRISPKSSIGRIDVLVRSIADRSGLYDRLPSGYKGEVWVEITPNSFNVRVHSGLALNQLRVFRDRGSLVERDFLFDDSGPVQPEWFEPGRALLHLSVTGHIGYEGIHTNEVIDLSQTRSIDPLSFFRPLAGERKVTLEKDRFYILATKEKISIPYDLSGEMVPFFHHVGELRVHYAGFFDPGFGMPEPNVGVLEVRPQESFVVYDGQPICLMELYPHARDVSVPYGRAGNNYAQQRGVRLAKYFR